MARQSPPAPDDSPINDEEVMIFSLATLLLMTPEEQTETMLYLGGAQIIAARGMELVCQYSSGLESKALLDRATGYFHAHWVEANEAAMRGGMTRVDRARWDQGERDGFKYYRTRVPNGRVVWHLMRLVDEHTKDRGPDPREQY